MCGAKRRQHLALNINVLLMMNQLLMSKAANIYFPVTMQEISLNCFWCNKYIKASHYYVRME